MASTLNQIPGRKSKILGWTRQLSMLSILLLHPLIKTKCLHFSFEPLFSNFTHTKPAQYNLITTKLLEFHWKRSKVHVKAIMSVYVIKLCTLCLVLMGMVELIKIQVGAYLVPFPDYLLIPKLPPPPPLIETKRISYGDLRKNFGTCRWKSILSTT